MSKLPTILCKHHLFFVSCILISLEELFFDRSFEGLGGNWVLHEFRFLIVSRLRDMEFSTSRKFRVAGGGTLGFSLDCEQKIPFLERKQDIAVSLTLSVYFRAKIN